MAQKSSSFAYGYSCTMTGNTSQQNLKISSLQVISGLPRFSMDKSSLIPPVNLIGSRANLILNFTSSFYLAF